MFYDIESIFSYWKGHISKYIVSTTKCINILDEISDDYVANYISFKTYSKKYNNLLENHKMIKKEYFNDKEIKSRRKFELIKDYNSTLSIIENKLKIYIDNLQSSV
jgi:hypothetical protein